MTDVLKAIYNACDPLEPANDQQYVDSDVARGSFDLAQLFHAELLRNESGFLRFLFSGHVGCGKSSELRHLAQLIEQSDPPYYPIIIDVGDYLDEYDVSPTDILLMLVSRVAQSLKKIGIDLEDRYLWKRLQAFRDVLFSDIRCDGIEAGGRLPMLADVTAKFSVLKRDPTNRELVRKAFEREIASLREEIALVFDKARIEIRKKRRSGDRAYADFVVIIDRLERIERIKKHDGAFHEEGYPSQRELFVERSTQLTNLGAHAIYTVPLPLVIKDGSELEARFGSTPYVLPMVKTEERGTHRPFQAGYQALTALIEKRIPPGVSRRKAIEDDALEFLIKYSGGNARQLVLFLRRATLFEKQAPIRLEAAQRAVADSVRIYSDMPARFWPKLAQLECSQDQRIDSADPDVQKMLKNLVILEYRNGGGEDDPFNPSAPWYAVHPIVRELDAFKHHVKALRSPKQRRRSK